MYSFPVFNRRNKMQRRILLVVSNSGSPTAADQSNHDVAESAGYGNNVVDYITASGISESDADGYELIMIAESVTSGDVGNTFRTTKTPFLAIEGFVWDDMDMTTTESNNYGTDIYISNATHPMADGNSGTITVYSSGASIIETDSLATDGVKIAQTASGDTSAVIFYYEKGSTMQNSLVAPERRIGFGLIANYNSTSEGLLRRAVEFGLYIN